MASLGFTLAELIVVIAIFGIIMSIALANQQQLNNNLLITNLAYEIGLVARETQAYGIGVRAQATAKATDDFQGGFGMNITLDPTTHTAEQVIVFKDNNNNKRYDGMSEFFSVYPFTNQRGNKITVLCAEHYVSATSPCIRGVSSSVNELNIVFKRPNPEASFTAVHENGSTVTPAPGGPAYIIVNTPAGKNCRAIVIETTGQIHVESSSGASPACTNGDIT